MAEKKSFLLYNGYFEQIKLLNIEQRGILLTAIMAFQTDEDLPEMDAITKMAYSFISADMRRDNDKYNEIVEKRRVSGRKGGIAKQANLANATSATFARNANQANLANVADNVDVNVDVNECVNDNVPQSSGSKTHTIPTFDEIALYCNQNGISTDISKFIQYNAGKGWPMDWKTALSLWTQKDTDKKKEERSKNRFNNFENSQKYDYGAIEAAARKRLLEGERA